MFSYFFVFFHKIPITSKAQAYEKPMTPASEIQSQLRFDKWMFRSQTN